VGITERVVVSIENKVVDGFFLEIMVGTKDLQVEQHQVQLRSFIQESVDKSNQEEFLESGSTASSQTASSAENMSVNNSSTVAGGSKPQGGVSKSPGGNSTASASITSESSDGSSPTNQNPLSINLNAIPAQGVLLKPNGEPMSEEEALRVRVRTQVEYYFSQQNLQRDTYMLSQMDPDGYIPISTVAMFKQLQKLTNGNLELIIESVTGKIGDKVDENMRSTICEVSDDLQRIKASWKRPQRTTIILREVKAGTTEADIRSLLDGTSYKVQSVRSDVGQNWFVTMSTEDDAKDALLHLIGKTLNGESVKARLKSETLPMPSPRVWQPSDSPGYSQQYYSNYGMPPQQMGYNMMGYPPRGQVPNWNARGVAYQGFEQNAEQQANWNPEMTGGQARSPHGQPRQRFNGAQGSQQNSQARPGQTPANGSRGFSTGQQGGYQNTGSGGKGNARGQPKNQSDSRSAGQHRHSNTGQQHGSRNEGAKGHKKGPAPSKSSTGAQGNSKVSAGMRKKGNNKSGSFANSKKTKTPVFKPMDFPSLLPGKAFSLDAPAPTDSAVAQKDTAVAQKPVVEYANVVAANPAPVQSQVEKPKPAQVVESPKEEDSKPVTPASSAVADTATKPVPAQATKSSESSWAGLVAKAAQKPEPQIPATAASPPKANVAPKDGAKGKPSSGSKPSRQQKVQAVPTVAAVKSTPQSSNAVPVSTTVSSLETVGSATGSISSVAQTVPRPKRGWEKPGLAPVTKLETKPLEGKPSVVSQSVATEELKHTKNSKPDAETVESLENTEQAASGEVHVDSSSEAEKSVSKTAASPWGQKKSFADVIKTGGEARAKSEASSVPSMDASSSGNVNGKEATERHERTASGLFGSKKTGDGKPRLSSIEGNWRQAAKKDPSKLNGNRAP